MNCFTSLVPAEGKGQKVIPLEKQGIPIQSEIGFLNGRPLIGKPSFPRRLEPFAENEIVPG
jgi:hypothetical protein